MASVLIIDDERILRERVTSLLEAAGHQVAEAENGQAGIEKLAGCSPDLVIVDFVMPKMNGFQFCAALRAMARYRDTPILLLSARTDQVGDRFMERFALSDAISKPFEDEALLAVVQNVLQSGSEKRRKNQPAAEPEAMGPDEPAADLEPEPGDFAREASDRIALSGETAFIALADVLQLIDLERQSGVLEVACGRSRVEIQLRQGQIQIARGENLQSEFLLGRYLVEGNLISRQDLDLFLKKRIGHHLLGEQLLKLDYVTETELTQVLGRQTADLVIETLRWNDAHFRFFPSRELDGADGIGNRFSVASLVMEGLRRVDEWRVIENGIPHFDVVFAVSGRGSMFDPDDLSYEEAVVFGAVDGKKTVRAIIAEADMGSFMVCKLLYRLLSIKLIRRAAE